MRTDIAMPFGWWVQQYEKRCPKIEFYPDEELFFEGRHGFMTWMISRDMSAIIVPAMCGDGLYWRNIALNMLAQAHKDCGVTCIRFCTRRNPEAYKRFMKTENLQLEKVIPGEKGNLYWMKYSIKGGVADGRTQ